MSSEVLFWFGGGLIALAGIALLAWSLFADRSRGRRRCGRCWYDMSKTQGLRCPECGREFKSEKKLDKTRRRWKWTCTSVLVFLAAGFLAIQPKVKRDGWGSVLPKSVLILCLRMDDNTWAFAALDARTRVEWSHPDFTPIQMVPHPSTLYQWQWRMLADTCMSILNANPGPAERKELLTWLARAADGLLEEDAKTVYQAMARSVADSDPVVREHAAIYCADSRWPEQSVELIRPLLNDAHPRVRIAAVTGLRLVIRHSDVALATLLEALRHDDQEVRLFSSGAIGTFAILGKAEPLGAFDALEQVYYTDRNAQVRARALQDLSKFRSQYPRITCAWRDALDSFDAEIRTGLYWTMSSVDTIDPEFELNAILRGVQDDAPEVREAAEWSFSNRIDSESLRPHIDVLVRLAIGDDDPLRRAALRHLMNLSQPPVE